MAEENQLCKAAEVCLLWAYNCSDLIGSLSPNILREVCTYFPLAYQLCLLYPNISALSTSQSVK